MKLLNRKRRRAADFINPDVKPLPAIAYRFANVPKTPGVYDVQVQSVRQEGDRLVVEGLVTPKGE